MENFINVITNENRDTYYIMNFHYYKKIEYITYTELYECDPVKEYLKLIKFMDTNIKNLESKLEENLQTCTQFINNTWVYIPQAICLVSKYPFAKQMEKCLESILKMMVDASVSNEEIYKFVQHITCEIPLPPPYGKLMFYIPYNPISIELYGQRELPQMNFNPMILFDHFNMETIISIHHLMLLEQKFLFVSKNVAKLTEVTESFLHLLFPMNWISTNTYIPVLTEDLLRYLQCMQGYVMGIEESMLKLASPYLDSEDTIIYIVNIDKKIVEAYCNKKGKKLLKKKANKGLPDLPETNYIELTNELKKLKKHAKQIGVDKSHKTLRDIFIKSMIMLFGDYKKYVSYIDGYPLFNTVELLKYRQTGNKLFYEELTSTMIFRQFLQTDQTNPSLYFQNMTLKYNSSINTQRRSASVKRTSTVFEALENEQNTSHGNINTINGGGIFSRKMSGVDNLNTDSISSRIQNSDDLDQYMVRPFCLNDNILSSELIRMDEIIAERYKQKYLNIRVITEHKELDFNKVGRAFKRFVFNDQIYGRSIFY
jgi:hypothetical protein